MRNLSVAGSCLWLVACATGSPTGPVPPVASTPSAASAPATQDSGPVVARVGDHSITATMLRAEMARRGGRIPGRYSTPEQIQSLLDELIRERAVVVAARAAGYDQDPEFVATVERILVSRYLGDHLDAERDGIQVDDAEVEAFYREHAAEFVVPTRVRGAWIFLDVPSQATEEKVEEARRRAEDVRAQALALPPETRNFGPVALRNSDDPGTRYIGGELGWVTASDAEGFRYGPEIVTTLLALEGPGAVSPVLRTEHGFALVKVVERQEEAPAPLEKLAPGIRSRILKEKREATRESFFAELLRTVPVSVDTAALATIEPIAPGESEKPADPPPLPGGG